MVKSAELSTFLMYITDYLCRHLGSCHTSSMAGGLGRGSRRGGSRRSKMNTYVCGRSVVSSVVLVNYNFN